MTGTIDVIFWAISVMAFLGVGITVIFALTAKISFAFCLVRVQGEAGRVFTFFAPGIGIMLVYGTHVRYTFSIRQADRSFH